MSVQVDDQTKSIIEYLKQNSPDYLSQVHWSTNCLVRVVDLLLAGSIGRFFLERGRKASGAKAVRLLTKAVSTSYSKKVMAKALFYRGNSLFSGAADADISIADYSLAVWCDPSDRWARKDRATIYEMYHASYGKGDRNFGLPMTHAGACADAEAAIHFFRSLKDRHPSEEGRAQASSMIEQCQQVLQKLKGTNQ